jgi:polysaccharide pyruvyl transferase WcaK-like protein
MQGYRLTSSSWRKFESASAIIDRISHCRIMITGTFHGAVFALSQGIPVIGLANSVE